ncbi:MAG: hypothetical protein EA412_01910 [Chitinophagaceae bacterium]|nr:MAG: hypothetical protein EA412_01910 [Chitinophagaceae bacterium]
MSTKIIFLRANLDFFNKSKGSILFLLIFFSPVLIYAQDNVGIGTTTPDPSALLEVQSSDKGFLPPRLTTVQRDNINAPAEGLVIYNTDTKCIEFFDSASWISICGGVPPTSPDFTCGDTVTFTYNNQSVSYGSVEGENGTCWMDRNLGASRVAVSFNDSQAYGDLFQWGRLADGHQIRTSPVTTVESSTDVPGHGDFISTMSTTNDWRNPQNNGLWQGDGGINDPCPAGWRVPTEGELNAERLSWSQLNYTGAFNSDLKWTAAGGRSHFQGNLNLVDTRGSYWTSTADGINSYGLFVTNNDAYMFNDPRGHGRSIRCILD